MSRDSGMSRAEREVEMSIEEEDPFYVRPAEEEPRAPAASTKHERRNCPVGEDGCRDCHEERGGSSWVQQVEEEAMRFS